MKRIALLALLGALILSPALADDDEGEKKVLTCPVSGEEIKRPTTVPYKDAEIQLCCRMCIKMWRQNPDRFQARANHQLVLSGQARQKGCPYSGRPLNDETTLEIAGVPIQFCCGRCKAKAVALEGDAAIAKIFGEATFGQTFEIPREDEDK